MKIEKSANDVFSEILNHSFLENGNSLLKSSNSSDFLSLKTVSNEKLEKQNRKVVIQKNTSEVTRNKTKGLRPKTSLRIRLKGKRPKTCGIKTSKN